MRKPSKSARQESLSDPARAPAKMAVLPQRPPPLMTDRRTQVRPSTRPLRGLRERTLVTSRGHPHAVFQRALERGNLWVAEAVAREVPHVSLEDALKLVHLYAEKQSPKYERAAMRWLERYLSESSGSRGCSG